MSEHIARLALGVVVVSMFLAGPVRAQTVELSFSGPETIEGPVGSIQEESYYATLTHLSGSTGAQGWSIIMETENAEFTDISVAGTTADTLINREPCFPGYPTPCSFETYQTGCGMACSAVVLDFVNPTTLPVSGTSTIVAVTIAAEVPECGGSATLRYVDAAGCFAGVAETNVVTVAAQSVTFDNGTLSQVPLEVEVGPPCDPAALIAVLSMDVQQLTAPDGVKTALTAILDAALQQLEAEQTSTAIALMEAFAAAVDGMAGSTIPTEEANALLAAAGEILELLVALE